jgi:Domain of unknown function (DUF4118)
MNRYARLAGICGIGVPLAVCAALVPLRRSFAGTAAALLLVAVIVAVAVVGNRLSGVLASISSALWFDFFLTRPYERFAIDHRADLETTISLFVVGLIVTELAARGRGHRQTAGEQADYVNLIYEIGEMVSLGLPAAEVVERSRAELVDLLSLRRCTYEPGGAPPHRTTVLWDGRVVHGGVLWGIQTMGLPGREVDLPVHFAGRTIGRFVLVPTPGVPVSPQRTIVAVAIASHAGSALASRARIA